MENTTNRSTLNSTRKGRTSRLRGVTLALTLAVGLMSISAFAQQIGTEQSASSTIPRGAVFIGDNNGGHWWVSDANLGLCELVPQNLPNQPPFLLNFCNLAAASPGQVVVGNPSPALALPASAKFVYVAEDVTAGTTVVRLVFSPSLNGGNGGFSASNRLSIPEVNAGRGGIKGGRPVGLALLPHNGLAANGGSQDLYVSYTKSGDITRVDGVETLPLINPIPVVTLAGSTSDGIGTNALVAFGNDLYIAEIGGFGTSSIQDPSGITRVACGSPAPCTAINLNPEPSTFPGGLTTDWVPGTPTTGKSVYIGDSPRAGGQHSILKYDPSTGASSTYSLNINPTYSENDVNGTPTTWTTYINPLGLGFNAATGDLIVGDDPQGMAGAPVFQQGHIWKVTLPGSNPPSVTSIAASSGSTIGGDIITVTGFNLAVYNSITGAVLTNPTISFGSSNGFGASCLPAAAPPAPPTPSTCTVTSPAGFGVVDVRVAIAGQSSAAVAADLFTYTAPASTAITVSSVTPNSGTTVGDTLVTITGQNLASYDANTGAVLTVASFNFGANLAPLATCLPTTVPLSSPVLSTCTMRSPAGAAGTVDVQASLLDANGVMQTSAIAPPIDQFTYVEAVASLYAWGITAPKGGATFIPGALGGHWWSSDHAQGMCRQDIFSSASAPYAVAGNTLHALNFSVCGDDIVGSAGQAAYDPNVIPGTTLHYVYVPDNAVKSTSVWRLTFDPATESMVPDPFGGAMATAMAPLADQRTLKPNGMSLGPDGNLYVSDLVEMNIRKLTTQQDPRSQTITIVAVTGDGRGANGTQGFIGNLLYVSGNRAAQFFDITQCPLVSGPCGMASVPAPNLVFIAGTATDSLNKKVYLANSPGGSPASILRYDASSDVYVPFAPGTYTPDLNGVVTCTACTMGPIAKAFITSGLLPAPGTPNGTVTAATTFIRPWDQNFHPTAGIPAGAPVPSGFSFVFGLATDTTGTLVITEDPSAGNRSGRGTMWTVPYVP